MPSFPLKIIEKEKYKNSDCMAWVFFLYTHCDCQLKINVGFEVCLFVF